MGGVFSNEGTPLFFFDFWTWVFNTLNFCSKVFNSQLLENASRFKWWWVQVFETLLSRQMFLWARFQMCSIILPVFQLICESACVMPLMHWVLFQNRLRESATKNQSWSGWYCHLVIILFMKSMRRGLKMQLVTRATVFWLVIRAKMNQLNCR